MFGGRKAGDLANGSKHAHGREDTQARQLHQKRHLIDPEIAYGKPAEFCLDLVDQCFKRLVQAQILLHSELLGRREFQSQPPFLLMGGKGLAWRWSEIMWLQDTVQAIASLCSLLHEPLALRN